MFEVIIVSETVRDRGLVTIDHFGPLQETMLLPIASSVQTHFAESQIAEFHFAES